VDTPLELAYHLAKLLPVDDDNLITDVKHQAQTLAAGWCAQAPSVAETVFSAGCLILQEAIFDALP